VHPLADHVATLFLRGGYAPARDDVFGEVGHRARIRWEWETGQWVLLSSRDNQFWGFMSWYRCAPDVFELLRANDVATLIARGDPARDLTAGPCVYIATAVVPEWAPRASYRMLYRLLGRANRDARVIGAWINKRNGRSCWHERAIH